MKNEQFTPGTFEVDKNDDNGETVIRTTDGRIVANLETDRYGMTDDEVKANAHLFAASKDMYETLKGVRKLLLKLYDHVSAEDNHILTEMEAALSKANPQSV